MSNIVIVAIPEDFENVWKWSSEEVPHMTIMNFGENVPLETQVRIFDFLEHAVDTSMCSFGLSVDYRGPLGEEPADVLYFERKGWTYQKLVNFRAHLLTNSDIRRAHDSTEQFPEWIPHLTLGHPETPAHNPADEHPPGWVRFDRIALWVGNFEGPTIRLKDKDYEMTMADQGEEFISHFGVKGMKWGVRKVRERRAARSAKQLEGASDDFKNAVAARSKAKKGGVKSLSNKELQDLITRMNLEQQLGRLTPPSNSAKAVSTGAKFAGDVILGVGKQQATKLANDQATKLVAQMLKK